METRSAAASDVRFSGKAIWSLVLGILSNFCLWIFGSIPAIILGIAAIKEVDASGGEVKGRGMAMAGIATGGVGILVGGAIFFVALFSTLLMPVTSKMQDAALLAKQKSELKVVSFACQAYAIDHDNRFPERLEELVPDYLADETFLKWSGSPSTPVGPFPYLYRGGADTLAGSDEPFLASPVSIAGEIAVAYPDGRVEEVSEALFEQQYRGLFP